MKILVVTPTFLPKIGEVETVILEIYQRLAGRHRVIIVTPEIAKPELFNEALEDKSYLNLPFEIHRFKDKLKASRLKFVLSKILAAKIFPPLSFSYTREVFRAIRIYRPDIVHFHCLLPSSFAMFLIRLFRKKTPIVLSLLSRGDVISKNTPGLRRKYMFCAAKYPDVLIGPTLYQMGELRYAKDIAQKIKIIPHGANVERFSDRRFDKNILKDRLDLPRESRILFSLQRLESVKRIDILIKSLKYIREKRKDVILVIGGDGPQKAQLMGLAKTLGLQDSVIFAGYISERILPEFFAVSDIFVSSSPNETFGIVLVQAMAARLPIVAMNRSAIPEVVENNLGGLLVNTLEPKDFAEKVLELLEGPSLYYRMSQYNFQKAGNLYGWEAIANQYEKVFYALLRKYGKI